MKFLTITCAVALTLCFSIKSFASDSAAESGAETQGESSTETPSCSSPYSIS